MVSLAHEAKEMGFKALGITGGEPFLLPNFENTIAKLADILPITVLTNGTLSTQTDQGLGTTFTQRSMLSNLS